MKNRIPVVALAAVIFGACQHSSPEAVPPTPPAPVFSVHGIVTAGNRSGLTGFAYQPAGPSFNTGSHSSPDENPFKSPERDPLSTFSIDELNSGGSTHGSSGIQKAYKLARRNFQPRGINRVILATDGDFNVGLTSEGDLEKLIKKEAQSGVTLTALGFGMGNLKDSKLQALAQNGNGQHAYLDSGSQGTATRRKALSWASGALTPDPNGLRRDFLTLARKAKLPK